MKKYEELQEKYAKEIARIKASWAQYQKARQEIKDLGEPEMNPPDFVHLAEIEAACEKADGIYQGWASELEALHQDIEIEYWDVPFAKAREQGIKKFYELAGLKA